jgi:hypothetical protein
VQVKVLHALRGSGSDGSNARPADLAGIVIQLEENIEECFNAVCAREHNPVVDVRILHQLGKFA